MRHKKQDMFQNVKTDNDSAKHPHSSCVSLRCRTVPVRLSTGLIQHLAVMGHKLVIVDIAIDAFSEIAPVVIFHGFLLSACCRLIFCQQCLFWKFRIEYPNTVYRDNVADEVAEVLFLRTAHSTKSKTSSSRLDSKLTTPMFLSRVTGSDLSVISVLSSV